MQALIRAFDPHGLISGGFKLGSRNVLQVSRMMSIDWAGRERAVKVGEQLVGILDLVVHVRQECEIHRARAPIP